MATAARIVDVRVALPDDWWVIPLRDPEDRRRAVRNLLDRQFACLEDRPLLRAEVAKALYAQTDAAAEAGARLLALSTQHAAGMPLAASLLLHWLDLAVASEGPGAILSELDADLRPVPGTEPRGYALDLARLPSGPTLRRVHLLEPSPGDEDEPSLVADYWVERPDGGGVVQLAFATPIVALRESFLELFDAVAGALRWVEAH